MSREIQVEVEIPGLGRVKGMYRVEYETPLSLRPCEGRILPGRKVGVLKRKTWLVQIHQDKDGYITKRDICPDK